MTVAKIGEVLGVSRTTVYRALRRGPAAAPARRPSTAIRKTLR
jgi:predicted transcriptional regulator